MTDNIDPELVDDREVSETDIEPVELPEYNPEKFELPEDYEYVEVEENGNQDEG